MSLTDELVKRLRYLAMEFGGFSNNYKLLTDAADTIEELSAKLANANMKRSKQYYDNDMVKVVRCKDCIHWGTGFPAETESVKCCKYAGYMVGENGYCVYGEAK